MFYKLLRPNFGVNEHPTPGSAACVESKRYETIIG